MAPFRLSRDSTGLSRRRKLNLMLRPYFIVLVIVAMIAAGCSWFQPANPASTEGQLPVRLAAAMEIQSSLSRDYASNVVALDAAKAEIAELVIEALEGIQSTSTYDQAAYDGVLALVHREQFGDAKQVAESIHSTSKRNDALGKVAKSQTD